jgi:anti-sigma regulatory factor (Ser/Thr protein kinase)
MSILRTGVIAIEIFLSTACFAQKKVSDEFADSTTSVFIKDLFIDYRTRHHFEKNSYGDPVIKQINLKYYENTFGIRCATRGFHIGDSLIFAWRLDGFAGGAWRTTRPEVYAGEAFVQPITYTHLPAGKYVLQVRVRKTNGNWSLNGITLPIIISPAITQTWWFWLCVISCSTLFIYFIVRVRVNAARKQELLKTKHEKEILELEMQALRAQMNPHFIFNSLNSINRFILQNDRTQASEYLTKFSRLVRMILQNSQASLISLESELDCLGLYLEMEALRFSNHFAYKISVSKDLEPEILKVPPLIIQPYVENAIWHGLMHKEEKGQLDIEALQEDNYLYVKVIDNGIGRKKAAEFASKSATKHKSMGLRITADRIAIMQRSNGTESPVTINDLVNADGSAAGTEVSIKIPVMYD